MDEPIVVINDRPGNKDTYFIRFVEFLGKEGLDLKEFIFYIYDVTENFFESESTFLIENLVPFLKENNIPYQLLNIDTLNTGTIPPAAYLNLKFDQGGKRELIAVNEGACLSVIKIQGEIYGDMYFYYPDFSYSARRLKITPLYIAIKNGEKDKLEKLIREVYAFSNRRITRSGNYIIKNGSKLLSRPGYTWDDIILDDNLKNELRSNIEAFFNEKRFFIENNLPYKRGFLLIGPPGNGKTMLCRVIAGVYRDVPFVYYQNESEFSAIHELETCFSYAGKISPMILCLEDIDVILKNNNVSTVLNLIDGLSENEGLLLIATTNHPENLDQNILNRPSRFDRVFKINPPDEGVRFRAFNKYLGRYFNSSDLSEFAGSTEGFSVAYIKEVCISALINAKNEGSEEITVDDVRRAIMTLKRQFKNGENYYEEQRELGFVKKEA
jgi:AAA+ superfamily predicted ATPase